MSTEVDNGVDNSEKGKGSSSGSVIAGQRTVNASSKRRVKLYVLNGDRQWDDRGTGYVSSDYVERLTGVALWVVSEADGSTLLESRIQPDTAYQKQQETLIVWSEADSMDLALSFQEREGCDEVWARICWVQGKDPSVDVTQDVQASEDEDPDDDSMDGREEPEDGSAEAGMEEDCENTEPGVTGSMATAVAAAATFAGLGNWPAAAAAAIVELPPCELVRLAETARLLTAAAAAAQRCALPSPPPAAVARALAEAALRRDYPRRMCCDLFPAAESHGDEASLQLLHEVATCLLLLNHRRLIECLTTPDERLLSTLGMLEYRPAGRVAHREFVSCRASHRQVLAFGRPGLADRIRRQYRLQYLLDCALPPPSPLDDVQFLTLALRSEGGGGAGGGGGYGQQSALGGMVLAGRMQIAAEVVQDDAMVSELLTGLADPACPVGRRRDLAGFLRELCCCCPSGQCGLAELGGLQERLLDGDRLLDALSGMCRAADDCPSIGAAATDVLQCLVDHSAPLLRDRLLHEGVDESRPDSELLLNHLVQRMRRDTDPEMSEAYRLTCLMRALLDPDAGLTNPAGSLLCPVRSTPVKPEFLRFFYQRVMPRLLEPLLDNTADDCGGPADDGYRMAQLQHYILGLATFCVEQHAGYFRVQLLAMDLTRRALRLLRSRHAFLTLSAVRFFRRVVAAKDDLLVSRCLIRQRLFAPVVELLARNGGRYNLVNSAILELFEYIVQEDMGQLIVHAVENHWEALEPVAYASTFRSLRLRYEQLMEKARECGNKRPPDSPIVGLVYAKQARRQQLAVTPAARLVEADEESAGNRGEATCGGSVPPPPPRDSDSTVRDARRPAKSPAPGGEDKENGAVTDAHDDDEEDDEEEADIEDEVWLDDNPAAEAKANISG